MAKTSNDLEATKRLMGALVRMKPKPHDEMTVKKAVKAKKGSAKKTQKSEK